MMKTAVPLPLDGVRVIDLTQVFMGPSATQTLADLGADVIKVEKPGSGDLSRWSIEPDPAGADNCFFCAVNRNKRSVALDLSRPEGQAVLHDLVRSADVIVNNFRVGVMERLNLGYESLSAINPRIIYASGTGYGRSGPYAHKGGQDVLTQAMAGTMARRADPSVPLSVYASSHCDYAAGMHLVQGILATLLQRERTGRGGTVDASLYDSTLAMQMTEAAGVFRLGEELNWARMPLLGAFETQDGAVVMVGAFKENPLRHICAALEIDDLSDRYPSLEVQRQHRDELQRTFRERFASNSSAYWIERLEAEDILCAPVRGLAEALKDPQTEHNDMIAEFEHPVGGTMRVLASPVHLSEAPFAVRIVPPALGQHTDEVLREIGYEGPRIDVLRRDGVLG